MTPTPTQEEQRGGDIPPEIYERAEILMDQFRDIEDDRELIARVLMATAAQSHLGLTPPQRQALTFIAGFTAKEGVSPSYSEIAAGLGRASKGNVHAIVRQLVERGAVRVGNGRARSIAIVGGP